jgi:monofunctional biosynthetic peptidoglycan transglycosylase
MRRLLIAFSSVAGFFLIWLFAVWPPPSWYRTHWPRETAFMARPRDAPPTAKSIVRGRLYRPVPLDSIAPYMQDAVMIGEDANFPTHSGIDYLALAHALGYRPETFDWHNPRERRELLAVLPNAWSRRDQLRGASTITQQLAKNLYLSPSRNPLRKVKEAVIAWRLESALGKRRIMELYLNIVELGEDVWGVEAASQLYFKRPAAAISVEEAAALAGALPFPLRSNPDFRPGRMRWRQSLILRRLRGEEVEVPKAEEEEPVTPEPPSTPDSNSVVPQADSADTVGRTDSTDSTGQVTPPPEPAPADSSR